MATDSLQEKHSVFIVDDHPIVREGFSQLINSEKDLFVCADAEDMQTVWDKLTTITPDLMIVDISLKNTNGIDLIKNLRAQNFNMPILVVSMYDESIYAERAIKAGAQGYIMKQAPAEDMLKAIRKIISGGIYLSEQVTNKMFKRLSDKEPALDDAVMDCLSDRELEIFKLIGNGFRTRDIADKLNISHKTVDSYYGRIKEKLNIKSAGDMLKFAVKWVQSKNLT